VVVKAGLKKPVNQYQRWEIKMQEAGAGSILFTNVDYKDY
jgi:imidazole glycerol phosphate synthase subunit HisF